MINQYQTHIIKVGNSKGVRIPKDFLSLLGTSDVVLEKAEGGIMIRPATYGIPPLSAWGAILANLDTTTPEPELNDWDVTLSDGLEDL